MRRPSRASNSLCRSFVFPDASVMPSCTSATFLQHTVRRGWRGQEWHEAAQQSIEFALQVFRVARCKFQVLKPAKSQPCRRQGGGEEHARNWEAGVENEEIACL